MQPHPIKLKQYRPLHKRLAQRKRSWQPTWKGPIEGWTINFCRKRLWHMQSNYEFEDLLQEAKLCFCLCRDRYPRVNNPAHFMALYKTTTNRHFNRLMKRLIENHNVVIAPIDDLLGWQLSDGDGKEKVQEDTSLLAESFEDFYTLILDLPAEISELLVALINGDHMPPPKRQRTNEFFCDIMGKDPTKVDLVKNLHKSLHKPL